VLELVASHQSTCWENFGAFLLGQQPAHRRNFAHLNRVAIEPGEGAMQAGHVAVLYPYIPSVEVADVRLALNAAAKSFQIGERMVGRHCVSADRVTWLTVCGATSTSAARRASGQAQQRVCRLRVGNPCTTAVRSTIGHCRVIFVLTVRVREFRRAARRRGWPSPRVASDIIDIRRMPWHCRKFRALGAWSSIGPEVWRGACGTALRGRRVGRAAERTGPARHW
jgi:hypothetical protein